MKKNKKGFTLVELLAVIVILALLIVITANTILPMMDKTKKNAMITYANRVLRNVSTEQMMDYNKNADKVYKITELTGQDDYYGCVFYIADKIMYDETLKEKIAGNVPVYILVMFSKKDKLFLNAIGGNTDTINETIHNKINELPVNNNIYITWYNGIINKNLMIEQVDLDVMSFDTVGTLGLDGFFSKTDDLTEELENFENHACVNYAFFQDEGIYPYRFNSAFFKGVAKREQLEY